MTDSKRQDRALNVMGVVTLVVTLAVLLVGVATILQLFGQGDTLDAQARTEAISGCRSEYAAELAAAEARLDDARDRRGAATFDGLAEFAAGDEPGLARVVGEAPDIREAVANAQRLRDDVEHRRAQAVTLSRTDPDLFLASCEERYG